MKYLKRYGSIVIMSLVLAAYMGSISAYAAEIGSITTLAEHVYADMDENSNVVANVIMDTPFVLLKTELDAQGNVWYLIETDMGIQGYLQAQNVVISGQGQENGGEASPENVPADNPEENPVDNNVPENNPEENPADNNVPENNPEENPADNNVPENNSNDNQGATKKQLQTIETINIRKDASTTTDVVGKIPRGTILDFISIQENQIGEKWYEISYNNIHGYIKEVTVNEIETPVEEPDNGTAGETDTADPAEAADPLPADETIDEALDNTAVEAAQVQQSPVQQTDTGVQEAEGAKEEPKQKKVFRGFRVDWVVVITFLASILCMAVIYYLVRRMVKIYKLM